jgi:hypothetical protein
VRSSVGDRHTLARSLKGVEYHSTQTPWNSDTWLSNRITGAEDYQNSSFKNCWLIILTHCLLRRHQSALRRTLTRVGFAEKGSTWPGRNGDQYAVASALAHRASDTNFDRICLYLDRMPTEFRVLSVRDATLRNQKIKYTAGYTKWAIQNHHVLA